MSLHTHKTFLFNTKTNNHTLALFFGELIQYITNPKLDYYCIKIWPSALLSKPCIKIYLWNLFFCNSRFLFILFYFLLFFFVIEQTFLKIFWPKKSRSVFILRTTGLTNQFKVHQKTQYLKCSCFIIVLPTLLVGRIYFLLYDSLASPTCLWFSFYFSVSLDQKIVYYLFIYYMSCVICNFFIYNCFVFSRSHFFKCPLKRTNNMLFYRSCFRYCILHTFNFKFLMIKLYAFKIKSVKSWNFLVLFNFRTKQNINTNYLLPLVLKLNNTILPVLSPVIEQCQFPPLLMNYMKYRG